MSEFDGRLTSESAHGRDRDFTVRLVPSCRLCSSSCCSQGWKFVDNMTFLCLFIVLASLMSAKVSYDCYKRWDAKVTSEELREDVRVEKLMVKGDSFRSEDSLKNDALEQKVDNLRSSIQEKFSSVRALEEKVSGLQNDFYTVQNSIHRIEQSLVGLNLKIREEKPSQKIENTPNYDFSKIHDLDKTGKADYALENSGGFILSTRETKTYNVGSGSISILGVPVITIQQEPRLILQKSVSPGECWPFVKDEGTVVIHLAAKIFVTHVSVEHIPIELSLTGKLDSAPRGFSFWGLTCQNDKDPHCFGNFEYDINGPPVQIFEVKEKSTVPYCIVEFTVYSNHGNPNYTCIYRIRVHGRPSDENLNGKGNF